MSQDNQKQLQLPIITNKQQKKTARQIMAILRLKKQEINNRIFKTQHNVEQQPSSDDETQRKCQKQKSLNQRLITEIPIYFNHQHKIQLSSNILRTQKKIELPQLKNQIIVKETQKEESNIQKKRQSQIQITHNLKNEQKYLKSSTRKTDPEQIRNASYKYIQQRKIGSEVIIKPKNIDNIFLAIPVNPNARTQQNTQPLKDYLQAHNMFFSKISPVISLCIIKLNKLFVVERKKLLYKMGEQIDSFFIILQGKVKVSSSETKFKKICGAGETIFEQILFNQDTKKLAYETAKTVSKAYLVEIKCKNYYKMKQEMIKYGYKIQFSQMESLIKRNFIMKNWIRAERDKI